ncbi:polysaccharide deacetylase [Salipaludibacillus sp. LMS25]|uniref:polysaccharide deacetylase family protein n=1 Tax=Salipaludibacillus sp. LMS25 TaxID=2924031 RepID=UPI0020D0CFE1|nr:polysaccharide deacetylase family protein [Salipaludibacillus sp. LMS25]UTR16498.1 polysaccharide deacetylase [Salipaludibacillus sp. LMS25]
MMCPLAILLFLVIIDSEKIMSTSSKESEEVNNEVLEADLEGEQGSLEDVEEEQGNNGSEEVEESTGAEEEGKVVYLTFDDGPTPATGKLLTLLNDYEMKGTFFTLAPNVNQYPDTTKRIVDEGHAIGLHGETHQLENFYGTAQSPVNEMVENQQAVATATGVKTHLIRTPYGSHPHLTHEQYKILQEHGFKLWDWQVDSNDWKLRDQRLVSTTIEQLEKRAHESSHVLLFHDSEITVTHIEELLVYLRDNGYETRILTEEMAPFHFVHY